MHWIESAAIMNKKKTPTPLTDNLRLQWLTHLWMAAQHRCLHKHSIGPLTQHHEPAFEMYFQHYRCCLNNACRFPYIMSLPFPLLQRVYITAIPRQ